MVDRVRFYLIPGEQQASGDPTNNGNPHDTAPLEVDPVIFTLLNTVAVKPPPELSPKLKLKIGNEAEPVDGKRTYARKWFIARVYSDDAGFIALDAENSITHIKRPANAGEINQLNALGFRTQGWNATNTPTEDFEREYVFWLTGDVVAQTLGECFDFPLENLDNTAA